jgi:uncharacterized protein YhbP (UPF0306 family)
VRHARLGRIRFSDAAGKAAPAGGSGEPVVRRSISRILDENVLCSIATVDAQRRAHINTAHFCHAADLVLYFLSHPSAQHCRNLQINASAAVTVFASNQKWGQPGRGVQLFGTCGPAAGRHLLEAERLYARRYPAYRRWRIRASVHPGGEYRFYRFRATRVKLMDEAAIGDGVFASAAVRRDG